MKKFIFSLALAASLMAPVTLLTTTSGCATSRQAVAYKTLAATQLTVDAAMKAYAVEVVNGRVSPSTQDQVRSIHSQYRAAFAAAVVAAQFNPNAATPENVAVLSANLVAAIQEAFK